MNRLLRNHFQVAAATLLFSAAALGQDGTTVTSIPQNLRVPDGHTLYLRGHATGTQNYVCVPGANGPAWKFLGPQATMFVTLPWPGGEIRQQIATHYLSANPAEEGTPRATWQHSIDTSTVWAKAIASFTDPPVASGAIPWLLLQIVGSQPGPVGGSALRRTTYIQRLNTSGGTAPVSGCDAASYGSVALVPYSTDYLFYKLAK